MDIDGLIDEINVVYFLIIIFDDMDFENKLKIGAGIYTIPDIAQILRLPNYKVNHWIKDFWDTKFGGQFDSNYSWSVSLTKAVSFHTMVELYTFFKLKESGVDSRRILHAHNELTKMYETPFPFAMKETQDKISTDGKYIYFKIGEKDIVSLDGKKQFNIEFIKLFFKKLDFDEDELASRLWPLGKDKSILCDPKRKFGLPIINSKNIYPETIFEMHKAGDSKKFLALTYNLTLNQIEDAIEYCTKAA